MVKIIECPRDALQGLTDFIPTDSKIKYINQLLRVGFDTLDFGSFVSPKAIPQMRDTQEVFDGLEMEGSKTKLLAIIANTRGGESAANLKGISYLGFPLSISETFQQRNTNKSIAEALNTLNELMDLCVKSGKELVVYLSMGFGNPYGDPYNPEMVINFSGILKSIGVKTISVADTIGISKPDQISHLIKMLNSEFDSTTEFGVHLHSAPILSKGKIAAAYDAGCRRFDGALLGYGGCPMAEDKLVGNIDTQDILDVLSQKGHSNLIDETELTKAKQIAQEIFSGN
jgi:hydroxymethylglutaryl-CoA lyase